MASSTNRTAGPEGMTIGQHLVDKSAEMVQSFKPVKHVSEHVCTFALYSHQMSRQLETHHMVSRLNHDFLQCAVYESDDPAARLIGVEYIISDRLFDSLPPEEQKLWHSHYHEIKTGLWANPRVPEMVVKSELDDLAKTYGKFWCTWQVDRGDTLPLGGPSLMMSPQAEPAGQVDPELVKKRDDKYKFSTSKLAQLRFDITGPTWFKPNADYWKKHGKGLGVDILPAEMKLRAPFP